jgi:ABC-type antimicrobial peptide transport system ATPase subunit
VRKGGADFGPLLPGLAVALVLFDGKDVEVGECRCVCGCSGSGGLLIAIVYFNTPNLDVWTFIAPEIRSDGAEIRQRRSAERTWVVE